jgi:hypothetical protein
MLTRDSTRQRGQGEETGQAIGDWSCKGTALSLSSTSSLYLFVSPQLCLGLSETKGGIIELHDGTTKTRHTKKRDRRQRYDNDTKARQDKTKTILRQETRQDKA